MKESDVLTTRNLSLSFGRVDVFDSVDVSFKPRTITAIIGPSGCGKSSLLTCLNRLVDIHPDARTKGNVYFNGKCIYHDPISLRSIRKSIGMVFQSPNPFPFSIRRNFALPLREHGVCSREELEERMASALQRVGLWNEVKERLEDSAQNLSGGQQQRLCIARALVLEPQFLLMDEPTSALDPKATRLIETVIQELSKEIGVVLVTHQLAQAKRLSQEIGVMGWRESGGYLAEFCQTADFFLAPQSEFGKSYIAYEQF